MENLIVISRNEKHVIDVPQEGAPLDAVLKGAGFAPQMPCGGKQNCGKCVVWLKGPADGPSERESRLLAAMPACPHEGLTARLACFCGAYKGCTVILPDNGAEARVLTAGGEAMPDYDNLGGGVLGAAFDVGTTTIALHLYDLPAKKLLSARGELNKQASFGADVLSRIAASNELGCETVRAPLLAQMNAMLEEAVYGAGRAIDELLNVVVTGNTTMLHFAAGLDPRGIGVSPFTPVSLFGGCIPAEGIFPKLPAQAQVYFPRCVGAYVGADIVCGLLTLDMSGGMDLFVDVGTNGEMALIHDGHVTCCATAAGPAFEGAEISMGMTASKGAIEYAELKDGRLLLKTIGNAPAAGICGTGLISAIAAFIKGGLIEGGGAIKDGAAHTAERDGQKAVLLGGGVYVTQQDIRAVQLAKAAISAGIETLLRSESAAGLSCLYLAGGFGSYIRPGEAAEIGLLPSALAGKTKAVGNAALSGASRMLFSQSERKRAETLAEKAEEISLSDSAYFMDRYVENMMFFED